MQAATLKINKLEASPNLTQILDKLLKTIKAVVLPPNPSKRECLRNRLVTLTTNQISLHLGLLSSLLAQRAQNLTTKIVLCKGCKTQLLAVDPSVCRLVCALLTNTTSFQLWNVTCKSLKGRKRSNMVGTRQKPSQNIELNRRKDSGLRLFSV